jgi:cytochrome P450
LRGGTARIARTGPTPIRELSEDHPLVQEAVSAAREWTEALRPLVLEARGTNTDDFLSILWREADDFFDPGWDVEDILGTVKLMFGAGSYTASGGIANALYLLLVKPEMQKIVRDGGEDTLTRFVEESLRLHPPAILTGRLCTDDLAIAGARVSEGQSGIMINAAANRDPRKFPNPDEIDLNRDQPRSHFAFHMGVRACPGQALARAEIKECVSAVLERLAEVRLDPDAEPPSYPGDPLALVREWAPLNVLFTPEV